jgi:hypothetical protein
MHVVEHSFSVEGGVDGEVRISAHRGRDFSVIVDAVSAGSWTMGVARK